MKPFRKHGSLILPLVLLIFANWFITSHQRVEEWYSTGIYPYVSLVLRWSLGWIPFSVGDLFYCAVIVWAVLKCWKFATRAWARGFKEWRKVLPFLFNHVLKLMIILAWTWLAFHALWGFNYYRKSIPEQFGFSADDPSKAELNAFAGYLLAETNRYSIEGNSPSKLSDSLVDSIPKLSSTASIKHSSEIAVAGHLHHPPNPQPPSFKPSLFGIIGNYMGYGGYYNPFTGEAQINDHMPAFMLPFIAVHEQAHQLGYAKESEANFIGYLTAIQSSDSSLRYAANLEMFIYANNALRRLDSVAARKNFKALSPIAIRDLKLYKAFVQQFQGPVDDLTTWFYSRFLHINNQPEGMYSYNKGMVYIMRYINKKPA